MRPAHAGFVIRRLLVLDTRRQSLSAHDSLRRISNDAAFSASRKRRVSFASRWVTVLDTRRQSLSGRRAYSKYADERSGAENEVDGAGSRRLTEFDRVAKLLQRKIRHDLVPIEVQNPNVLDAF